MWNVLTSKGVKKITIENRWNYFTIIFLKFIIQSKCDIYKIKK